MRIMSKAFLTVQMARKSKIASTVSNDALRKMELSPCCQNRSLTKPVHVASQKPMKKRRCIKNRFSNCMSVASLSRQSRVSSTSKKTNN